MKFGKFSRLMRAAYTDRMDIYRYSDQTNLDGSIETVLGDTPVYSDVICRLSFSTSARGESPADVQVDNNPITTTPKIFCEKDTDVQAGDVIKVSRRDDNGVELAMYGGNAGLPAVYATHQEFLINVDESS